MSAYDFFVQVIGFAGTILFFLSFQCRKNQNLFRVQLLSYLCYTTHLLMLGAITGGISYILNLVRSFCLGSNNAFLKGKHMCRIICALQLVTLLFTWDGWYSIFILAGICINTYCMSLSDPQKVRKSILVTSPLVLVYDLFARSIGGTVYESVALCSAIIGILRMRKKGEEL